MIRWYVKIDCKRWKRRKQWSYLETVLRKRILTFWEVIDFCITGKCDLKTIPIRWQVGRLVNFLISNFSIAGMQNNVRGQYFCPRYFFAFWFWIVKSHWVTNLVLSIALAEPYRGLLRSCSCGERREYRTISYNGQVLYYRSIQSIGLVSV
mgnify:CR=1 FL=1